VTRLAIAAALILALAQLLVIGRIELTFDEAYYAMWARWPQAGYFDHPPMVAWWIAGSEALFGGDEFGVRAPFWLAGAALPGLVYLIGLRLYRDAKIAGAAALIFLGAPLIAGAPLATPDTPLVFFWTLALLGLVEVWRGRNAAWALVGLAAGAAGLSKMTAGFLGAGIVLALLATPSLRRQFFTPGPYAAGALALAALSPFLWWNATHGFATFLKQGGRLEARSFAPRYLAEFLGSQALLFNPVSTLALVAGVRRTPFEPARLLWASAAPALGYFLVHALHDRVQGNWPAPLYPALALLTAGALAPSWRWIAPVAAGLGVTLAAAAYLHLATGWPAFGPGDPALRIGGWRDLSRRVFELAREKEVSYILTQGYAQTALLTFYGLGATEVFEIGEPERWAFRPSGNKGTSGLAFGNGDFEADLRRRFAHVTRVGDLQRQVFGAELDVLKVFVVGSRLDQRRD
jgi:4-amino-4-deoxy-L-arabinose transferase-like glycosyltransferase